MTKGCPGDVNVKVLVVLSKYFDSLDSAMAKRRFVDLLPTNSPCVPFDGDDGKVSNSSDGQKTGVPKELYLPSSDLSAFAGVGVFHKVSRQLTKAGVSDAFLLALGVVSAHRNANIC